MEVTVSLEGNNICFNVKGRLTSDTFTILENAFASENGEHENYYLDLSGLEYTSSAGLRIILAKEKRLRAIGKHLTIRGCSSEVMDIFKVSGFDQILHFEEALPIIDISNLKIIGSGLCGEVYKVSDDTILKLYKAGYDISMIENEKRFAREALIAGVPTAISLNVVRAEGRLGILFEMLNAKTLKNLLIDDFANIKDYMIKLAGLLKTVHEAKGNEKVLPNRLDEQRNLIIKTKYLSEEERKKALAILDTCDRGTNCIHGDFHPGNVMISDGELLFIDMGDFAIGSPYQDISQLCNIYVTEISPGFSELMTGLNDKQRQIAFDYFLDAYFDHPSPERLKEIHKEIEKYQFARQFFFIENFEDTREDNLVYVHNFLKNYKF